jgi:hypothetical protein
MNIKLRNSIETTANKNKMTNINILLNRFNSFFIIYSCQAPNFLKTLSIITVSTKTIKNNIMAKAEAWPKEFALKAFI